MDQTTGLLDPSTYPPVFYVACDGFPMPGLYGVTVLRTSTHGRVTHLGRLYRVGTGVPSG